MSQRCSRTLVSRRPNRLWLIVFLVPFLMAAQCGVSAGQQATVRSFVTRLAVTGPVATLQVVGEICANINCADLLLTAFGAAESTRGAPSAESPVFVLIDKSKNNLMHWTLTDAVARITVAEDPGRIGPIALNIINEDPLKIELWTDRAETFTVKVEFK